MMMMITASVKMMVAIILKNTVTMMLIAMTTATVTVILQLVHRFIDGVEDMVNETGVEENIGVVTFGGTSKVIQNLTNDFARVRDAIGRTQQHSRVQLSFVTVETSVPCKSRP